MGSFFPDNLPTFPQTRNERILHTEAGFAQVFRSLELAMGVIAPGFRPQRHLEGRDCHLAVPVRIAVQSKAHADWALLRATRLLAGVFRTLFICTNKLSQKTDIKVSGNSRWSGIG